MRILAAVSLTITLFGYTTASFAANWLVGWSGADGKSQNLTISDDQEYRFDMGRFKCNASKISLDKIYDEVFERRTVSCQVSEDTYVSTDLSYNIKSKTCIDARSLTIYDKDKIYIASLFVHCK